MHGSWVRLLTIPLANDAMQKNTNDDTPLLSFFHPFFFKPHSRTASRFCTSPLRVPSPHLPVAVLHQTLDKATSLHGEVLIVCQSIKIKTKEKHAGECKERSPTSCARPLLPTRTYPRPVSTDSRRKTCLATPAAGKLRSSCVFTDSVPGTCFAITSLAIYSSPTCKASITNSSVLPTE